MFACRYADHPVRCGQRRNVCRASADESRFEEASAPFSGRGGVDGCWFVIRTERLFSYDVAANHAARRFGDGESNWSWTVGRKRRGTRTPAEGHSSVIGIATDSH